MSLYLTKHHAIKTYGGVEGQMHARILLKKAYQTDMLTGSQTKTPGTSLPQF
jgi:hypothetical protein